MLKICLKFLLQKLFGFNNYLFTFSIFTIQRHRLHQQNRDFNHFVNMIPKNGNVLDIGSNIGITAIPLAKRVLDGRTFCFEPIPTHTRILHRVIHYFHLSNIEVFETALGAENGELTMVMPEIYNVKFQGFSHVVEKEADKRKGEFFNVMVKKLDDIPEIRSLSKIHAIKIDVENFEFQVLQGAEELLRKHKPILFCEIWDNEKRWQTINYLKEEFGYQIKVFEKHELKDFASQPTINIFFL